VTDGVGVFRSDRNHTSAAPVERAHLNLAAELLQLGDVCVPSDQLMLGCHRGNFNECFQPPPRLSVSRDRGNHRYGRPRRRPLFRPVPSERHSAWSHARP